LALRHRRYAWSLRASTVWFGWLLIVNVRSRPNWASIGLGQDALVGVRQSSTLLRVA